MKKIIVFFAFLLSIGVFKEMPNAIPLPISVIKATSLLNTFQMVKTIELFFLETKKQSLKQLSLEE